jgi:hypothetical protein
MRFKAILLAALTTLSLCLASFAAKILPTA